MNIVEQIREAIPQQKPQPIEVPEWKTTLYLKTMSVNDTLAIETLSDDGGEKFRAVLIRGLSDEAGKPVFQSSSFQDIPASESAVLSRLVEEILEFNRIRPIDKDAAQKK